MRGRADQVCDGAARPAHHASRDPPPPDQYVWEFTDEDQGASFSAFGFMWQVIKVKAAGTGLQNRLQTKITYNAQSFAHCMLFENSLILSLESKGKYRLLLCA